MESIEGKILTLHEFREESKRWHTNNTTGMDFKCDPLKQHFDGYTRSQQDTMLWDLIESLSGDDDSTQVQPRPLGYVLHGYLHARSSIHTIVHDQFKEDLVPYNMLAELPSPILLYPECITQKWCLEFVRMCDFIRHRSPWCCFFMSPLQIYDRVMCWSSYKSTHILTSIWC